MGVQLRTTPVFLWNYRSKARIKNNQGGTSSGKTYNILQVIFLRLIYEKKIATIVGQDIPNLKKGVLRDFKDRILIDNPWMNNYILKYNQTSRTYTFKNGSIMEFVSFKDKQDAQSGKREILFINEANGIKYEIYQQVALRTTEEIFLDYNPSSEFWVHDHIVPDPKCETFYSNFSHNPYCDESIRDYLFDLKDKDQELWDVYGLGKTGTISETIYKNWTIVPEMPTNLRKQGYGMDFGYGTAPTTLIHCGLQNKRDLYIDELMYGWKFKLDKIDSTLKELNLRKSLKIYADSAHPLMIDELHDMGHKIKGVTKGSGSVNYGIEVLQDYNWHITERSFNVINEVKRYKRKIDKVTGKVLDEPVKAFDHAMDGIRYYGLDNLKRYRKRKQVDYG